MSKTEIIEFNINEDYRVEIKRCKGSYGEYYSVNGTNYDIHFPIEWVFQTPTEMDTPCFGPEECNLCAEYGYYRGVFIGYCLHCAKHADFKRGNGMISSGVEMDQVEADLLGIPIQYKKENSMWNTYLKDVSWEEIGDSKLEEEYQLYKDMPDLIDCSNNESDDEFGNYDFNNFKDEYITHQEKEGLI